MEIINTSTIPRSWRLNLQSNTILRLLTNYFRSFRHVGSAKKKSVLTLKSYTYNYQTMESEIIRSYETNSEYEPTHSSDYKDIETHEMQQTWGKLMKCNRSF